MYKYCNLWQPLLFYLRIHISHDPYFNASLTRLYYARTLETFLNDGYDVPFIRRLCLISSFVSVSGYDLFILYFQNSYVYCLIITFWEYSFTLYFLESIFKKIEATELLFYVPKFENDKGKGGKNTWLEPALMTVQQQESVFNCDPFD